ncbi:MAG TPA: DegV family protein [Anaerolineae bacterium]|nr:DegV family protein [Anaerolineae bacterium]HOQ98572.1 DegV family protein [Anaerolineae bacterium]HPL27682.1 DegV family protein [Anaerolineae bacterium]
MSDQPVRKGSVRIVTDTTVNLPPGYAEGHHIEVVPQVIIFGEESLLEAYEISSAEFVRRLKTSAHLPKTAAPPPGEFVAAYRRQLAEVETIISIHPTTDASGTVRSAETAKEESFPDADIRIIDTRTIGGGLGAMVMAAAEWVEAGVGAGEIVRRLQGLIPRSRTYFVIRTLEYLQKGGRIGGASALLGSILQIKPILEIRGGRVEVLEKVRAQNRAMGRLLELVAEQCPRSSDARVCVMHADAPEEGQHLLDELQQLLGVSDIPLYELGAAITTHAGPGVVGVNFLVE